MIQLSLKKKQYGIRLSDYSVSTLAIDETQAEKTSKKWRTIGD